MVVHAVCRIMDMSDDKCVQCTCCVAWEGCKDKLATAKLRDFHLQVQAQQIVIECQRSRGDVWVIA